MKEKIWRYVMDEEIKSIVKIKNWKSQTLPMARPMNPPKSDENIG
jgi:hypothetical protein